MRTAIATIALIAFLAIALPAQEEPKLSKPKLPTGWTKLGLSDKQKTDFYDIAIKYRKLVNDLEKQITDLRAKERTEQSAILTEAQKATLRKLLIGEDEPKKGVQ